MMIYDECAWMEIIQCWTNNGTNDVWRSVTSLYAVTQCACTYSDTIRNAGSKHGMILRLAPPRSHCWINILMEYYWSIISAAAFVVFRIFCSLEAGRKMSSCRWDTSFRQLLIVEARLCTACARHSCCSSHAAAEMEPRVVLIPAD